MGMSVRVAMMEIGIMRVTVHQPRMRMKMGMRLARRIGRPVRMLVVRIVTMAMLMHHRFVHMLMRMMLGEMEEEAETHQHGRSDKGERDRIAEDREAQSRAKERGRGEIGAGARRPQMAQRQNEEREAGAIAEKAEDTGGEERRRRGPGAAPERGEAEIDAARREPFHHRDIQRIGARKLARQIVVDRPGERRACDRQRGEAWARCTEARR